MKKIYIVLFTLFLIKITNAQWISLNSGTTAQLNSVYFTDANTGYAVGNLNNGWSGYGTILKTTNSGVTWTALSSGYMVALYSVYFIDANIGYAVGDSAYILKTTNGGITWFKLTSGISAGYSNPLYSVYFTDANTGYAVGFMGNIVKTSNAGASWTKLASGTNNNLYSVKFTDANTGYVVGNNGTILKTTNAGTTWTVLTLPGAANDLGVLNSIYFINSNTGYMVGSNTKGFEMILETTNAGVTWTVLSDGISNGLFSIYLTDINTGYAVGGKGTILKTANAGNTLTNVTSGTINDLESTFFTNANTGYAVGASGTILKYENMSVNISANYTTICSGTSTQLSASPSNGTTPDTYSWASNPAGFSSTLANPTVVPATNTTYTVTVTDAISATATGSVAVIVLPLPTVTANPATTTICSGQIVTLSAGGAMSYLWDKGIGTGTPIKLSPITTTTYTVTGTYINSCQNTAQAIVTINSLPTSTASASKNTICVNDNTILTASTDAGHNCSLRWSNTLNNNVDNGSMISFNAVASLNQYSVIYTVTATDENLCSDESSVTITVNPLPATPVISQAHDTLVSNVPAGNQWYMTSGSILNATNSFYIPQATDDYYVIVTANGCSSHKSNMISFIYGLGRVDTLYAPLDNAQQIKDSIILSAKDSCLFDYTQPMDTFYIASVQINGSQMQFNWVFKQGVKTYHVVSEVVLNKVSSGYDLIYITIQCNEVKKKGSLHSTTFVAPYYISLVSVGNIMQSPTSITIYPNPASDKFTIGMDNLKESYTLEILNTVGQIVLNKQITNPVEQVDLSGQSAGVYFVKLQTGNNTVVKKIIKQ